MEKSGTETYQGVTEIVLVPVPVHRGGTTKKLFVLLFRLIYGENGRKADLERIKQAFEE